MKISAGLLVYRFHQGKLEVFLIHPGGPFWMNKDAGAWSIPKGEVDQDEAPLEAACREFHEETGFQAKGPFLELDEITQSPHKKVKAFAAEGDYDPLKMQSNTFSVEWPPKSGKLKEFPEADRAQWFTMPQARRKILQGQIQLLNNLEQLLTQRRKDVKD
jgi:predicted NUDIX family NTP pyrophosphohydrolase